MIDEFLCRRPSFRAGTEITLADGQPWTFPAPRDRANSAEGHLDHEYEGLVRVVWEAEDSDERHLAELALAIYLIDVNYQLSPEQLDYLFTFPSRSAELAESQRAFDALAQEHLHSIYPESILSNLPVETHQPRNNLGTRLLRWLRGQRSRRKWFLPSRKREAIP